MHIIRVRGLAIAILGNEPHLTSVLLALKSHEPLVVVTPPQTTLEVEPETDLFQDTRIEVSLFRINRDIEEPTTLKEDGRKTPSYSPNISRQRPLKHNTKHFQQTQVPRKKIFRRR